MSEAAKRAAELIEQAWTEFDSGAAQTEQCAFEQYIQHVSDVAKDLNEMRPEHIPLYLRDKVRALILPEPVDPLVEAISEAIGTHIMPDAPWGNLRTALKARGLQITPIGDGEWR